MAAYPPLPIGQTAAAASVPVVLATDQGAVPVTVSTLPAGVNLIGQVAISGGVAISNFPATQPVSGTVAVSNFPVSQPVTGTFWQATQPVSLSALPALPVGGNIIGTVGIDQTTNGTTNRVNIGSDGTVALLGGTTVAATQSGNWTVQPGNTPNTTAWLVTGTGGNFPTTGNVASGSADSGNPVKVGGIYNATLPTLATGQRGDLQIGLNGQLTVGGGAALSVDGITAAPVGFYAYNNNTVRVLAIQPYGHNGASLDRLRTPGTFKTFTISASSAETTIWTPTSGKKFRLMGFHLYSDTATVLTFRDNTAGSAIYKTGVAATRASLSPALGNGILSGAANNVLTLQCGTAATVNGTIFGTEE